MSQGKQNKKKNSHIIKREYLEFEMEHVTSFHDKYADSKRKRLGLKMEKDRLEENFKLGRGKKSRKKT